MKEKISLFAIFILEVANSIMCTTIITYYMVILYLQNLFIDVLCGYGASHLFISKNIYAKLSM